MTSHSMKAISPKSRRKRKRDFIVTKNVSDGAEVSLREPTKEKRDFSLRGPTHSQERMRRKKSARSVRNDGWVVWPPEKVGSLRSVPQKHPGCTQRK
jgi:hypothetical protein